MRACFVGVVFVLFVSVGSSCSSLVPLATCIALLFSSSSSSSLSLLLRVVHPLLSLCLLPHAYVIQFVCGCFFRLILLPLCAPVLLFC